ncbi:acyltransferase [bacterium]|nr:acyltransferase [bacterium]
MRYENVNISARSKVNYRCINLKKNCILNISTGSIVEAQLSFECEGSAINIGHDTFIGGSHLVCSKEINIGNDVLISWGCTIVDHNSHSIRFSQRKDDVANWYNGKKDWSVVERNQVNIKDKAWIGFNSIIIKGVTVGEGAVVGAGSIVTKDVAPWTIVAGNPAKTIRSIPPDER